MKQLYQIPRTGQMRVAEVPAPQALRGCVVVQVRASLVSAGTERSVIGFARKSLLEKARSRPDLVRQLMEKARREGVLSAYEAAVRKLDQPQSLGYSCAGVVLGVGEGVTDLRAGDAVACAGAGYANHAEIVAVPRNLVAPFDAAKLSYDEAAFATVGAIAMHGLRLAEPQLGGNVAVIGLGLIGLLTVQLAEAAGCTVFGMDPDARRCELARSLGAKAACTSGEQFSAAIAAGTQSLGCDAVVITAATSSSAPVELAAEVARGRAKVVSVGAVGTTLPRDPYFKKELEFRVSRSYGPGRYDPGYEEQGHDYPPEFVRWTENRNLGSFLELAAAGKLKLQPLITHRFPIEQAEAAYALISGATREAFLGVLLQYGEQVERASKVELRAAAAAVSDVVGLGVIGAGNFANGVLLPAFKRLPEVRLRMVGATRGSVARHSAETFEFEACATEAEGIIRDPGVQAVVIATRHETHAAYVRQSLAAGKHVFCEKPLCLSTEDLSAIAGEYLERARSGAAPLLMVGFNRRFAPMTLELKRFLADAKEPLLLTCRVNGGYIPAESWIQQRAQGGGRIVGEVCHYVDLLQFLAGSRVVRVSARALPNLGRFSNDNLSATLELANGSLASITYAANGDKSFSKERVEVFGAGATAVLDDFRELILTRDGRRRVLRSRLRQQKGHAEECAAFVAAIRSGKPSPVDLGDVFTTTAATFAIEQAIASGESVAVPSLNEFAAARAATTAAAGGTN